MKNVFCPDRDRAIATLAGCALPWRQPAPAAKEVELQLVTINDFHGNIEASKYVIDSAYGSVRAPSRRAASIRWARPCRHGARKIPELLLVGAGDLIGASPAISSMWADEPTIGAMNLLGLKVSSVGNHEFDAGRLELLRQQKGGCASPRPEKACQFSATYEGAKFQYLAANVIDMVTRKPLLPAYKIEQARGVKVAFIGTVLRDAPEKLLAWHRRTGVYRRGGRHQPPVAGTAPAGRAFVVLIHQGGRTTDKFDQQDCSHLTGPDGRCGQAPRSGDPAGGQPFAPKAICARWMAGWTQADMGGHVPSRIKHESDLASQQRARCCARVRK
jgi:5'-nucleotidase